MSESEQGMYQELLEFVYMSPFALARIDERGAIDMMNAQGANLLMEFAAEPEITNLFDVLDVADPEVRHLVAAFAEERGPICEGRRIAIERFEGGDPLVLSLTVLKLGPGRIMVAFGDISRLEAAHSAQRFLLDRVSDGLATVDASGAISAQCSARLNAWFGAPIEGEPVWAYLGRKSPRFGALLDFGWQCMLDDVLPLDLYLDQLPRRLDVDGVPLGVSYQPQLTSSGKLSNVLVVVRDLTAELERERLDLEQRELMAALNKLTQDRDGFRSFLDEASIIVRAVGSAEALDRIALMRALHTLKGNFALFGLRSLSGFCHGLEDALTERREISAAEREELATRWNAFEAKVRPLLGDGEGGVALSSAEFIDVVRMLSRSAPGEVVKRFKEIALTPVYPHLSHLAEQAVALSERLGKAPLETVVEAAGVRCSRSRMMPFWQSLIHAVRNAVDHGIETEGERVEAGKPAHARLELRASMTRDEFHIEVRDDGRGIDWTRLAERSRAAGLPTETRADLVAALFADGISSRDAVTELSGRGVGMSAMKRECTRLGGEIDVESAEGVGTTLRIRIPMQDLRRPSILPRTTSFAPMMSMAPGR